MDLSLSEAARLLGKSERQVRYLVRGGTIPARKEKGRWVIRREDLPLSEGQERAERQKTERAARLAEEILRPEGREGKKGGSVFDLHAFRDGTSLYHELLATLGAEHAAVGLLREALMLLACGYHEFEGEAKAELYAEARQHASRAVATLFLEDGEAHEEIAGRVESLLLPALGGLIHQAEKRGRRRRR